MLTPGLRSREGVKPLEYRRSRKREATRWTSPLLSPLQIALFRSRSTIATATLAHELVAGFGPIPARYDDLGTLSSILVGMSEPAKDALIRQIREGNALFARVEQKNVAAAINADPTRQNPLHPILGARFD